MKTTTTSSTVLTGQTTSFRRAVTTMKPALTTKVMAMTVNTVRARKPVLGGTSSSSYPYPYSYSRSYSTTPPPPRFSSTSATIVLQDSYENVLVEKHSDGKVGVIKLHRPKALNALSDELFSDLLHAVKALDADPTIGCIIVTGSTSKAFAAGADISQMQSKTFAEAYATNMFAEWASFTSSARKPVIAAVSGYALGGGCELAMMCDFIVATDTAQFGQPEVNLGVIPGAGGTQRLTRAIGKSKSMYLCLTGELVSAREMYDAGLVAKIVDTSTSPPDDDLLHVAVATATKIADKGQVAVQMIKEAVNASQELSLTEGLRLERRLFHSLFATHDQKEGMKAFLEKRKPNFKNE